MLLEPDLGRVFYCLQIITGKSSRKKGSLELPIFYLLLRTAVSFGSPTYPLQVEYYALVRCLCEQVAPERT